MWINRGRQKNKVGREMWTRWSIESGRKNTVERGRERWKIESGMSMTEDEW